MSKSTFSGFPTSASYTPLPNILFSSVFPQIQDVNELKVILHVLWLLYRKQSHPKFVVQQELLSNEALMDGMCEKGADPVATLHNALMLAVERGVLLQVSLDIDDIFLVNSEANRVIVGKLQSGEMFLGSSTVQREAYVKRDIPDIFSLYEQNIGLITPMIAEDLKEAEKLYAVSWIEQAIKEAVSQNKRNWRYVSRILERWAREGKGHGESEGHSAKEISRNKYLKGKYGHLIRS